MHLDLISRVEQARQLLDFRRAIVRWLNAQPYPLLRRLKKYQKEFIRDEKLLDFIITPRGILNKAHLKCFKINLHYHSS